MYSAVVDGVMVSAPWRVWAGVDIISGGGEATARVTVVMITPVYTILQ